MVRAWFGVSACVALVAGSIACDSGSSRPAPPSDPCLVTDCSDGAAPTADASVRIDAGRPRDAAITDDARSGAVFGFDGARPEYDAGPAVPVRDAAWEDGGVIGPGGPVPPADPPNRAVCTNAGPLGFSTAALSATAGSRGAGSPDAGPLADPFTSAWAAAAARTGSPGPLLLVLDTLGLLPAGGARSLRLGTPRAEGPSGPFGFLAAARNPIATSWSVVNTYLVSADTGASPVGPVSLRFKASGGAAVEIPIAGARLDARFVIEPARETCTAIDVRELELYVPTSAGSTTFEGRTLSTWLGAANHEIAGQPTYWRIVLRGSAPVVTLSANP
jgi:hypothetical protein